MSKTLQKDLSLWGRFRDEVGFRVATLGLYLATPWYRAMISGAIRYGLDSAKKGVEGE